MTSRAITACVVLFCALSVPPSAGAQPPPDVERPDAVQGPPPDPDERRQWPVVRVGGDFALSEGQEVREVTVVAGNATIAGHVYRDVVVVLGAADIAATAVIEGSLTVIGGHTVVRSGAKVAGDFTVVGGSIDAPPDFMPGRQQNVIGSEALFQRVEAVLPFITRGLLWGRLIVPELPWMWWIVGFFFFLYFVISLVAEEPVRACAAVLSEKPLTTFLIGLLTLLLTGPVVLILTASFVGIAVVPFALCALMLAGLAGRAGVARWIGSTIVPERGDDDGSHRRAAALRSFVIGFAILCVAYMIPVLGIVAWSSAGVLGLGAGVSAFIAYYQRENPAKPRRAVLAPGPVSNADAGAPSYQVPPAVPPVFPATAATTSQAPSDLAGFPFAPFRDRLAAFALDVILVILATAILDLGPRGGGGKMLTLLLIYHVGFWAAKGTTVGGIICQLRVIRAGGAPLTFADALVRGLSSILSLAVLGIGALWILKDPEHQAWHDKIAGTYVVKVPRNYPV